VQQISVVVTNHNYGKFLGRCIRSLLNQTLKSEDFEIIVVDDASSDDSLNILNLFGSQIKVVSLKQNMGLAFSSNAGIGQCISRYIVRVDADDYVHPKFLETLLLAFELMGGSYEAVSCDYSKVDLAGNHISYESQTNTPIACAVAFKMEALETLGFYNSELRINEEVDLLNRFRAEGMKSFNVSLPLYRYVQHDDSLTKKVIK